MDFPNGTVVPPYIPVGCNLGVGQSTTFGLGGGSTASLSAANIAFYVPLTLPWPYTVRRMYGWGGFSNVTVDLGVYSLGGGRIWHSGGVAFPSSGAQTFATLSPDLLLSPGQYFLAIASSSSSGVYAAYANALYEGYAGVYYQTSAYPLPAQATLNTMATSSTNAYIPILGITNKSS